MPEIELVSKELMWQTLGPFMITGIAIIVVLLIGGIILRSMRKGLLKEITRVGVIICLALVAFYGTQVSSYILSQ